MRAQCVGVHPLGVAWLHRQKSGGVATVMRFGNCDEGRDSSTPAENVGDVMVVPRQKQPQEDAQAGMLECGG
jgi:hypothetical protein